MKQNLSSALILALIICTVAVFTPGQQQYSGGQVVSISNVPHVIVDTAPTTAVTGTFFQGTQPVSLAALPALVAGTAKVGITYPFTSCGTTAFSKPLQAMPTSATAIAVATTCLLSIDISNTTGGALTVTITDNQGSPITWLNAVSMAAGETRSYNFPNGKNFTTGIKVTASGAGITYSAEGLQ
jgi:hypothetical protein